MAVPKATWLDIILYDGEFDRKTIAAHNIPNPFEGIMYDYRVVFIKPQTLDYTTPMDPITIFRNALGPKEGGSGTPIDRAYY